MSIQQSKARMVIERTKMTKLVIFKCDICEANIDNGPGVIGIQTYSSDGKIFTASPEQCYTHVCKSCAYIICEKVKKMENEYE